MASGDLKGLRSIDALKQLTTEIDHVFKTLTKPGRTYRWRSGKCRGRELPGEAETLIVEDTYAGIRTAATTGSSSESVFSEGLFSTSSWDYLFPVQAALSSTFLLVVLLAIVLSNEFNLTLDILGIAFFVVVPLFIVLNLIVSQAWSKTREQEIRLRLNRILSRLKEFSKVSESWSPDNFPNLYTPVSPCISLQWTIRDGHLVSLPWPLLVKGDVVVVRPGQEIMGKCAPLPCVAEVDLKEGSKTYAGGVLDFGDIYAPRQVEETPADRGPVLRAPRETKKFVMLETPYLRNVRLALQNSWQQKSTKLDLERSLICGPVLHQKVLPAILLTCLLLNFLRWFYFSSYFKESVWMAVVYPSILAVTPSLPLVLPLIWIGVHCWGNARLLVKARGCQKSKIYEVPPASGGREDLERWSDPTFSEQIKVDPFSAEVRSLLWNSIFVRGQAEFISVELLQVLASCSALCCVDKKGLLSWPNPTVDKLLFLRRATPEEESSLESKRNGGGRLGHHGHHFYQKLIMKQKHSSEDEPVDTFTENTSTVLIPEILSLSHDLLSPSSVHFDDPSWKTYLKSVKPLGLAALLNTCNFSTHEKYAQFASHIMCEALHAEETLCSSSYSSTIGIKHSGSKGDTGSSAPLPREVHRSSFSSQKKYHHVLESSPYFIDEKQCISERGCLCELAREMGFKPEVMSGFQMKDISWTFQHFHVEDLRQSRLARHLMKTQVKFPFPYMVSAVIKEIPTNMLQVITQGTGDIILDSCSDVWDGTDLVPLTPSLRKKILDFYHRNSLLAYCTSFAYRPMFHETDPMLFKGFLELPTTETWRRHRLFNRCHESPEDSALSDRKGKIRFANLNRCLSTDSLIVTGERGTEGERSTGAIVDSKSFHHLQRQQVFLGMVTLQYQVRYDAVRLVEQLERACVRFVHFSKENELRSRVFSERMGLESGWNCHISLLKGGDKDGGSSSISGAVGQQEETPDMSQLKGTLSSSVPCILRVEEEAAKGRGIHHYRSRSVMHRDGAKRPSPAPLGERLLKSSQQLKTPEVLIEEETLSPSPMPPGKSDVATPPPSPASTQRKKRRSSDSCHSSSESLDDSASSVSSSSSSSDEDSPPVAFDMSNRAKLPRGIDAIRPHLRDVDNVPLLVSLFTDCTPAANQEMIKIMQENGQTIIAMGSTASAYNAALFWQADAAIGFEPLFPHVCARIPVVAEETADPSLSPMAVASMLNSLPCAVSFTKRSVVVVLELMMEARLVTTQWYSACVFWLSSSLALSSLFLLSALLMAPPILSLGHVFWINIWVIPIIVLAVGLSCDLENDFLTDKNRRKKWNELMGKPCRYVLDRVSWKAVRVFLGWFAIKFLPSVLVIICCFLALLHFNRPVCEGEQGICEPFSPEVYRLAQDVACLAFVLYMIVISSSFVSRHHHVWERNPLRSRVWLLGATTAFVSQAVFFLSQILLYRLSVVFAVPWFVWMVLVLWCGMVALLNELVKRKEIKLNIRLEKRARLDFGTKLGMNSPF